MNLQLVKEYIMNEYDNHQHIELLDFQKYTFIFNQCNNQKIYTLRFNLLGFTSYLQDTVKEEDFNISLTEETEGLNLHLDLDEVDNELQDHIQNQEIIDFVYHSFEVIHKQSLKYELLNKIPMKKKKKNSGNLNLDVLLECFQEAKTTQPLI